MRGKHIITGVLATFILIACGEQSGQVPSTDFGELTYHPPFPSESFVLCKGDTSCVDKNFSFEFNEDASSEGEECYAEFEFVDNDGKSIPTSDMEIFIIGDAVKIDNANKFRINAQGESVGKIIKEITIRFRLLPEAKEGTHQGFLRMYSHKMLDRIDNCSLGNDEQETDVLQWTIHFKKEWNPLALLVLFVFCSWLLVTLLFYIWKNCIKQKMFGIDVYLMPNRVMPIATIDGCVKIVITSKRKTERNHFLHKVYNGPIAYINVPNADSGDIVIFVDYNGDLNVKTNMNYLLNNMPIIGNMQVQRGVVSSFDSCSDGKNFQLIIT